MSDRLRGKRAIITGAGNGQGRAVALAFAREGAHVLALDIDRAGLDGLSGEADGTRILTMNCDVSDEEQVRDAVGLAVERMGGIDILYNNAAVYLRHRGDGPTHEVDRAVWDTVLGINLGGVFLMVKHAAPHLIESGAASIVNVASIGGIVATDCHAYAASKGAVISLTRSQARTYARYGVRANAIAPGVVETALAGSVIDDSSLAEKFRQLTPLRRFGTSQDIVPLAVLLASDEASYITGATIPVDGGVIIA